MLFTFHCKYNVPNDLIVKLISISKCTCRCESCHGQAERLLDSAREMEDSIAVSLRFGYLTLLLAQGIRQFVVITNYYYP